MNISLGEYIGGRLSAKFCRLSIPPKFSRWSVPLILQTSLHFVLRSLVPWLVKTTNCSTSFSRRHGLRIESLAILFASLWSRCRKHLRRGHGKCWSPCYRKWIGGLLSKRRSPSVRSLVVGKT